MEKERGLVSASRLRHGTDSVRGQIGANCSRFLWDGALYGGLLSKRTVSSTHPDTSTWIGQYSMFSVHTLPNQNHHQGQLGRLSFQKNLHSDQRNYENLKKKQQNCFVPHDCNECWIYSIYILGFFVWYRCTLGPKCIFFFPLIFMQYLKFIVFVLPFIGFVNPSFSSVRELGHKADVHLVHFQSPPCAYKHKDVEERQGFFFSFLYIYKKSYKAGLVRKELFQDTHVWRIVEY